MLSLYTSHPEKYEFDIDDYFEGFRGKLETSDAYYNELISSNRQNECIARILFWYFRKKDSKLCIGVLLSDFFKFLEAEQKKWVPFIVDKSSVAQKDIRFKRWYARYIEGSSDIEGNSDAEYETKKKLSCIIENLNACCKTLVGKPLYTAIPDNSIKYPISQNSHAYEDAHQRLYGFLVDSLSRDCLLKFANLRNQTIPKAQNMRLLTLLQHVFNEFDKDSKLHTLLAKVSEQRSKASHGVRGTVQESNALEDFQNDLKIAVKAYQKLLELIETEFNVSSEHELGRHQMMENYLPKIAGDVPRRASIRKVMRMVGKKVEKVWFGMCENIGNVHESEVLYIQFTDGEILAIDIASNVLNIVALKNINPNDFCTDFSLKWLPTPSNKGGKLADWPNPVFDTVFPTASDPIPNWLLASSNRNKGKENSE